MTRTTVNIVIHHCPCGDGLFSCLVHHLYFKKVEPENPVHWIGRHPINPVVWSELEGIMNNYKDYVVHLYVTDFPIDEELIAKIDQSPLFEKVIILDHHKTSEVSCENAKKKGIMGEKFEITMDMNRSAATICLDYFQKRFGPLFENEKIAKFEQIFQLVEDRDLFRFKFPETKNFGFGLWEIGLEFDPNKDPNVFDKLLEKLNDEQFYPKKWMELGDEAVKRGERLIAELIEKRAVFAIGGKNPENLENEKKMEFPKEFCGTKCFGVHCPQPDIRNDLGNRLAQLSQKKGLLPMAFIYYEVPEIPGFYKVSIRALDGPLNSAKVSEFFGGGGHRNANSFSMKKEVFQSWVVDGCNL